MSHKYNTQIESPKLPRYGRYIEKLVQYAVAEKEPIFKKNLTNYILKLMYKIKNNSILKRNIRPFYDLAILSNYTIAWEGDPPVQRINAENCTPYSEKKESKTLFMGHSKKFLTYIFKLNKEIQQEIALRQFLPFLLSKIGKNRTTLEFWYSIKKIGNVLISKENFSKIYIDSLQKSAPSTSSRTHNYNSNYNSNHRRYKRKKY